MEAVTAETGAHLGATRLEHLDQTLVEQPITRADYARMRIATDQVRAFLADTLTALETGRADAMLRVLEVKAVGRRGGGRRDRPGHEGRAAAPPSARSSASSAASATPGRPGSWPRPPTPCSTSSAGPSAGLPLLETVT